jgi:3-hydroxyacyl-CoA dehydrogenase
LAIPDIVNIDRAMRWGFAWKQGRFELLDAIGPTRDESWHDIGGVPGVSLALE